MKKHYSYSVKDELVEFFHGDTITEMRLSDADGIKNKQENNIPRAWAFADYMALNCFLCEKFLLDTVPYDDYIAYFVKSNHGNEVFLSFMHFEKEILFSLDPEYAYELVSDWKQKGYKAHIMRNCVGIDNYSNGEEFRFTCHLVEDRGTDFLIPFHVNGKYIFVRETVPFRNHAVALLFSAVNSDSVTEYKSILEDNAVITRSSRNGNSQAFVKGIPGIMEYFACKTNVFIAYVRRCKSVAYNTYIVADNSKYKLCISRKNQITRLEEEPITSDEEFIPVPSELMPSAFAMPEIVDVRTLDIYSVHAYGIRLEFAGGCVKNYYISSINEEKIPETVSVEGYIFNKDILESVKLVYDSECSGVVFSNGYYIPVHILYYRGVTQLVPEKITGTVFENEDVKIEGLYRVPLHINQEGFSGTYHSRCDELYGPGDTLLDEYGNRITDYSGDCITGGRTGKILLTISESSNLTGYIKKDGSWLIPPIFDEGSSFEYSSCVKVKKGEKNYLLNELGELIDFPYDISVNGFKEGLCEFSTGRYEGEYYLPEEEYFEYLSAGNWGFIDKYGKIVVEPQYVFTSGFRYEENRAFVAKAVDGKVLWGLINEKGEEIIPCIYGELSTHCGTVVDFREEGHDKFGIMDFDGNIIMEPRYHAIYEYNEKHGLIAFFNEWEKGHQVGVARIDSGEVIIPEKYCYIGFEEDYIECEKEFRTGDSFYDYYDYDGNRIPDKKDVCEVKSESEFVVTGKNGKYGVTTRDGKVILPEKFSDISIANGFITVSCYQRNGWHIIDELYTSDGTLVFSDTYRRVIVKKDILTRETPMGVEYYRIIKK